jgi:hypothetical protein
MRTGKRMFLTLFVFVVQLQLCVAQSINTPHPNESIWVPQKVGENQSNVINGVQFYAHKEICNSKEITLIRLVNTNTYPARVTYQMGSEQPLIHIRIPGSTSIEGSCSPPDENVSKLVISFEGLNKTEKHELIEFMIAHIAVSKL